MTKIDDDYIETKEESFRCDLREDENQYLIDIEVPGRNKEDIKLKFRGNDIYVSLKDDDIDETFTYLICERLHNETERVIPLNKGIDRNTVNAKFKDGILSITVRKLDAQIDNPEDLISIQ